MTEIEKVIEKINDLKKSGLTYEQIGERLGKSKSSIIGLMWRVENGQAGFGPKYKVSEKDILNMAKLRKSGMSIVHIAAKYNISKHICGAYIRGAMATDNTPDTITINREDVPEGLEEAICLLEQFKSDRFKYGGATIDDAITKLIKAAKLLTWE